ncbi:Alpha/Beta hydrolase protein [Truncatella angustata]|uniref:Alpha/Beta hydrolase protein n=1 Tax=Truncatella angustata TaxID=152316 RepID=A0A9P8UT89_9PEZI|nr:Alpha/Beta hydrolase protein [Truncatella angustata]KAH6657896.1 Alpha/Beta hydrolase protein [Truncatella angustata]
MEATKPERSLAEDIKKHPAFPTAVWNLVPDRQGLLPVAANRGGPIDISWEVHGEGPIKVLWICGLGFLKGSYQRQTMHFGHYHADRYSILLVDNRGMGGSGKPLVRYSTSEMAQDIVEVLDHVGWTSKREVNVCGLSMGGMIAQELGVLIPDRIATLNLLCTAAAIENTTTFSENMMNRITMLLPKSLDRTIEYAASKIFAQDFLNQPDTSEPPTASTPKVKMPPNGEYLKFKTNFDRFAAQEITKQMDKEGFTRKGFLLQLIACGWHHKSPAQLKDMADKVGRERILVLHGTQDGMISLPHGKKLIEYIQPDAGIIVEGMGHASVMERTEWLAKTLEERFAVAEKLGGGA